MDTLVEALGFRTGDELASILAAGESMKESPPLSKPTNQA